MPGPVRASLSRAALRASPYITSGVARGLSSRAIADSLAAAGMGVRRTDLLAAIRQAKGEEAAADVIKFTRKDYHPDPARIPAAATRTLRRFAFTFEVSGYDNVSGESRTQYVTVSSSRNLTVGEMEDMASALTSDPEVYGGFVATGATIKGAKQGDQPLLG